MNETSHRKRHHAIGAALTAATLGAVLLTGCGDDQPEDCPSESPAAMAPLSMTVGGSRPAPRPAAPAPRPVAPAPKVPTSKPKGPKVDIDFPDQGQVTPSGRC